MPGWRASFLVCVVALVAAAACCPARAASVGSGGAPLCDTFEHVVEVYASSEDGRKDDLMKMLSSGECRVLDKGTDVRIINQRAGIAKVSAAHGAISGFMSVNGIDQ